MKLIPTILLLLSITLSLQAQFTMTKLTCEYMDNPTVVDEKTPHLSWINHAKPGERGQKQTAYQIRVASSIKKLRSPDLWNSGKILSDASTHIKYAGKALTSRTDCHWQVRVWDINGKVSAWSPVNTWRMGLLDPSDWTADWIGAPWQGDEALPKPPGGPDARPQVMPPPAPLLRKQINLSKKIRKAIVYTTGLGYFEFYANGHKVSDDLLVPNLTNYDKRPQLPKAFISLPDEFRDYQVMYLAYDLTPFLHIGQNAIGAILGNGFYNAPKFWTASYGSPRFLAQLFVTYQDGTEEIIRSDTSWKVSKSAITSDLVYHGEVYDSRNEQPDWCIPGLNDASWESAVLRRRPFGRLVAHTSPTDKITKTYQPLKIEKLSNGHYKVDFAEEISGWVRLKNVTAPTGHQIKITFNANVYSGDNTFTFNGQKNQTYAPRFNWFVFSGVDIENWYGELLPENIQAEAINTDVKENAVFETSNPLFNQINQIWRRSQLDNMHGAIASDCPHRERSPYTGDGQVACQTVMHNFDARAFYKKWIRDMLSAQIPATGYVPNGAPWQPGCGGGVAWGSAIQIIPWEFYQQYGDPDILKENYEGMTGYMRYMSTWVNAAGIMYSQRTGLDGKILKWWNLGDWAGYDDHLPPDEMVHTFYYWLGADITAKTALILGKTDDAARYKHIAEQTRLAFMHTFYNEATGSFGKYGANIFALKMGVLAEQYQRVMQALQHDIAAADGHLDTGIFGTRYFFEVLAEHGLNEWAYNAMNKTTYPSFGHWIALGSTTTREQWDETGSFNHPMFGGGLSWFYRNLAGMRSDETAPGYKKIIFKPMPAGDIKQVKYTTETNYGRAGISWNTSNGLEVELEVPVGSTARLYFPKQGVNKVLEHGQEISTSTYVKKEKEEDGYDVFSMESGKYLFTASK
ncbi:MAG: family 78 glycoside hydrolase catalytic domain [Saprospiraceae bacterium]|nr:family 78 glycoside hydrolase catalytic domain [Saprospiraceae bacterium]